MASLMPVAKQQYFDSNGVPLSGGKVYTYAAGTTTPLATYSDKAGVTPNTNPVILDSRGEATIFWGSAGYKVVLKDSTDVTVWTQDNLYGSADQSDLLAYEAALAASSGSSLVGFIQSGSGAVATTVQAKQRESVSVKDFGAVGDGVTDDTAAFTNAVASGHSLFVPSGTYLVNASLTLAKGQWVSGEGRNLTVIKVPDAFSGVLFTLKQGAGVEKMTLTKTTVGTYSSTGTACAVDYSGGAVNDAWNTTVRQCLIQNFGDADLINNYRHLREGNLYFYNYRGTRIAYQSAGSPAQAAGTVLISNCAYLYTFQYGIWADSLTTNSTVIATTFEFGDKHIVCDGVLSLVGCYIADFGAFCITGSGTVYVDNHMTNPLTAGSTQPSAYGSPAYNWVTTDNEYAIKVSNGVIKNASLGVQYQLESGNSRRGAVIGAGTYNLENCYLQNNAGNNPALYALEYSSTINQQILQSGQSIPNYFVNGTFTDRSQSLVGWTDAAQRNAWGGAARVAPNATACDIPFVCPADYTLGDPLMCIVFVGAPVSGSPSLQMYLTESVGITEDTVNYTTLANYSSRNAAPYYVMYPGFAYGPTYNIAQNTVILKCTTRTGYLRFYSWGANSRIHAVVLTPITANNTAYGKPIGWFTDPTTGAGDYTVPYSASVSIDAYFGSTFTITATNGTAFTINTPINGAAGKQITIKVRNTSGGALGAITWTGYKMAAWTSPATGNSRSITFEYDGTNWIEISRTTADVPN